MSLWSQIMDLIVHLTVLQSMFDIVYTKCIRLPQKSSCEGANKITSANVGFVRIPYHGRISQQNIKTLFMHGNYMVTKQISWITLIYLTGSVFRRPWCLIRCHTIKILIRWANEMVSDSSKQYFWWKCPSVNQILKLCMKWSHIICAKPIFHIFTILTSFVFYDFRTTIMVQTLMPSSTDPATSHQKLPLQQPAPDATLLLYELNYS